MAASDATNIPTSGPAADTSTIETDVVTGPSGWASLHDEVIAEPHERLFTFEELEAHGASVYAYISRSTDASLKAFAERTWGPSNRDLPKDFASDVALCRNEDAFSNQNRDQSGTDEGLTFMGLSQRWMGAYRFYKAIQSGRMRRPGLIIRSPLRRAQQTASPWSKFLDCPVVTLDSARELPGYFASSCSEGVVLDESTWLRGQLRDSGDVNWTNAETLLDGADATAVAAAMARSLIEVLDKLAAECIARLGREPCFALSGHSLSLKACDGFYRKGQAEAGEKAFFKGEKRL